jgi:asparagine synthase (glutamine-hydrolysing)
MCGIVGFLASQSSSAVGGEALAAMRDRMAHRGPDDAGLELFDGGDVVVGLGHRRLSILDLSPKSF